MHSKVENVPAIRFKGFKDVWVQRKLGDIAETFEYGLNAAATDFDGINKYIRITDIDDESREFKANNITSPNCDLSASDNYKLQDGDILFARTGASVGKTYHYAIKDGLVYFAGFLIRARLKNAFDTGFVYQNTFTKKYGDFIRVMSQRSGQPGVNAQEYAGFSLGVPCAEEQRQLGTFFRTLDNTIAIHKRKLTGLRELKKAYLQRMFPQEGELVPCLRFAGFTEPWVQCKLGDVAVITMGQSPDSINYTNNPLDNILVQGNADMKNGLVIPRVWTTQITKKADKGDIIFSVRAPVGDVGKTDYDVVLGRGVAGIKGNEFIYQTLIKMNIFNYWERITQGSTFESINSTDLKESIIYIPEETEQTLIASFFRNFDNHITAQTQKVEHLKQLKKLYLQKMLI